MSNNKTILIGPTGFLGPSFLKKNPSMIAVGRSCLPDHLSNEFFPIEGDLDFKELDNLEFDNVIFLIGSSDHHVLNASPSMAIEKNVLALSRFLWYLRDSNRKVNKIINFTTMLQYDTKKMILPCNESQPRNSSVNNYVLSKFVSELITEQHRDKFSIIDVRISNVYGPTKLMRPDIVPSVIWSLIAGKDTSVWTKEPKRDFIFVDDAIDAVIKLLDTEYSGPVNLGSGVSSSVNDICSKLESLSGMSIADQGKLVSGHMEFVQDISLIKSLTGWSPKKSLDEGLEITFHEMSDYFKEPIIREDILKQFNGNK
tara:strand:- start:3548 stop:4486 length:939 start_codon:yes stop_codon:yes gene_type:complete